MNKIAIRVLLALILSILLTAVPKAFGAAQVTVSFDTGTKKVFADASRAAALSSGSLADGDGCVVELGYYRSANAGNKFAGEWVALTGETSKNSACQRTSIGDTAANGAGAGTVAFSANFVVGSSTAGNNLPAAGTPLAVRFYNARTVTLATGFNVVSSNTWLWREPQQSPGNPVINLSLDDSGLVWLGGTASAFAASQSPGTAAPLAGTYQALIGNQHRGALNLRVLGSGGDFSAVIALEGRHYRFRGVLDENGRWQGSVARAGGPLQVSLLVSKDQLDGVVVFPDGTASPISGGRLAAATANNPSTRHGAYTLVLVPAPDARAASQTVPGFAAMAINARGSVRITGKLPDGTAFSTSTQMLRDDRLLLTLQQLGRSLAGEIVFRDQPRISDADGVFYWEDRRLPMLQLNVIVSKYGSSAPVLAVDASATAQAAGNLQITIAGASYEPVVTKPATLSPSNHLFVPNPRLNQLPISLSTSSGIFRGSFLNSSDRRVKFSGAIFQKQQLGVGQFRDNGGLGEIELSAVGN